MAKKRHPAYTRLPSAAVFVLLPAAIVGALAVIVLTAKVGKTPTLACTGADSSGIFDPAEKVGYFEGKSVDVPPMALLARLPVLSAQEGAERWIEVDLSEQKLVAWEGDQLFLETKISTGLPQWPTPVGEFRVWTKLRATKMEGGSGKYYYNLPNVPFVMFFENGQIPGYRGYGLHGTYWHNDFGTRRSHGCVNLPTPVAQQLFYWIGPALPEGKGIVRADAANQGTRIVIHE